MDRLGEQHSDSFLHTQAAPAPVGRRCRACTEPFTARDERCSAAVSNSSRFHNTDRNPDRRTAPRRPNSRGRRVAGPRSRYVGAQSGATCRPRSWHPARRRADPGGIRVTADHAILSSFGRPRIAHLCATRTCPVRQEPTPSSAGPFGRSVNGHLERFQHPALARAHFQQQQQGFSNNLDLCGIQFWDSQREVAQWHQIQRKLRSTICLRGPDGAEVLFVCRMRRVASESSSEATTSANGYRPW
jgi:hypothetical protein